MPTGFLLLTPSAPPVAASGHAAQLRQAPPEARDPGHHGGSVQWGHQHYLQGGNGASRQQGRPPRSTGSSRGRGWGQAGPRLCPAGLKAHLPHPPSEQSPWHCQPLPDTSANLPRIGSSWGGDQSPGLGQGTRFQSPPGTTCKNREPSHSQSSPLSDPAAPGTLPHA